MNTFEWSIFFCAMIGMFLVPVFFAGRMISAIFSTKSRDAIRKKKVLHCVWFVVSVLFVGCLLTPNSGGHHLRAALRAKTRAEMNQLQIAIIAYQNEYDTLPPGKDNAVMVRELISDNPRQIAFLNLKPTDMNAAGEVLDAWHTPMRITLVDPQHPLIKSAGPDKTWDTPDDISSQSGDNSSGL